jgi:FkbM family methyltransferase
MWHKRAQINRIKHNVYKLLNRTGLRPGLAALSTVIATIRAGKVCKVSYFDEGWVQRFPSRTLVEPRLSLWTPAEIERWTWDLWMYQYHPNEGDTIVDVGAGTGWETLLFSKSVGKSGRVISIEAHPRTFRCLSKMCELNQLENVTVIQAAIVDQEREIEFSDGEHEGNSIIGADSGIRVAGTTLDSTFRSLGLSQVDFLKMNIEGAERLALSGMKEMVEKTKMVCISCHDFLADAGQGSNDLRTKADVIHFLKQSGFAVSFRESDARCTVRDFVYGLNERFLGNTTGIQHLEPKNTNDSI